jgi:hypothetical protein
VAVDAGSGSGIARYGVAPPATRALTLIGSPLINAELDVSGAAPHNTQLAGRLWVARGSYRPEQGSNAWQLHPAGYRLERGHGLELELLGADVPYGRPSNAAFSTRVENLRFSVPTRR